MKAASKLSIAVAMGIFGTLTCGPVSAQQVLWYHPQLGPMCSGPLGPGPCAAVHQFMQQQQMLQQVPPHLQPGTIIGNVQNDVSNFDVRNPPNRNNDLVGRDGWVRQRLGF
ncbi:hypothetical protein ABIB83_005458 [Bradyrhizobium sp. I1.8.5]|uniref:hypothetical protein n=1 Tax=Bradyrhizobium sp. I1.8.5 TaxID=3156365 RepID=UPI0033908DA1